MRALVLCICISAVCLFATLLSATDYTAQKKFDKSEQDVYLAAQRAVSRIGGKIERNDVEGRTLTFTSSTSVNQGISGYRAEFVSAPDTKSGKTIATLRIRGAVYSQNSTMAPEKSGRFLAMGVAKQFFSALKKELGLPTHSSPVTTSGGLIGTTRPTNLRLPD